MAHHLEGTFRPLLEAVSFAARAHQDQLRKDNRTPYASHPFRVCLIVREAFGVSDPKVLKAAILHDTVEDTTTDHDDLAEKFGREVADWVGALSKDKRLPEDERERVYCDRLAGAPWQVQVCKLADIADNLLDRAGMPDSSRSRPLRNARRYLSALEKDLKEEARQPWRLVTQLLADIQAQEPS